VSPVRKPAPIVVRVERRETDDPTKRRELVLLLAKLLEGSRRSGRKSR
jgi:hypothetical protein